MVFCYKIMADSPRRDLSPRKRSPDRLDKLPSSLSQLINIVDYEGYSNRVLDSIPEREWRFLAAIARKREANNEREKLADEFRKMWQKEKEEREMIEAASHDQYNRYIKEKRDHERSWLEYKRLHKSLEQQVKAEQLLGFIKHKEQRSADLLAWCEDKKTTELLDKAVDEELRAQLAAERRSRIGEAEECRRRMELYDTQQRMDDACKRRNAILKDASQRVAITNALSSWESSILRGEVLAMEAARSEAHRARVALTQLRAARLQRARDARLARARKAAALAARLREALLTRTT